MRNPTYNTDPNLLIESDDRDEENGNASHVYSILERHTDSPYIYTIHFQHGPIKENGVNGITNEILLAIVIDRLEGFQTSAYKCRENAIALTKIDAALHWLQHRTSKRVERMVEGTSVI